MKLLLDTNAVLFAAQSPHRISEPVRRLLAEAGNQLTYSVTALWEIAIKNGSQRSFDVDAQALRGLLQEEGFQELPVTGEHALALRRLPRLHRDPFDRILLAQALVENMTLITSDRDMLRYKDVPMLPI